MVELSTNFNANSAMSGLEGIKKATPQMIYYMVDAVCKKGGKYARRSLRAALKRRSGQTSKSLVAKGFRDGTGVIYFNERPRVFVNIFGATIYPKNSDFLYFTGHDGKLRRCKKVVIPARSWLEEPDLSGYLNSSEPIQVMQKKLNYNLEREWKKESTRLRKSLKKTIRLF